MLLLSDSEQSLYPLHIRFVNDPDVSQIPFLLLCLLGEDVALVSVLPPDFSRSGKRETLFRTGVGLQFRHS